jgi:hypothetical protein
MGLPRNVNMKVMVLWNAMPNSFIKISEDNAASVFMVEVSSIVIMVVFVTCFSETLLLTTEVNGVGARGSLVVKALGYKQGSRGFETR